MERTLVTLVVLAGVMIAAAGYVLAEEWPAMVFALDRILFS